MGEMAETHSAAPLRTSLDAARRFGLTEAETWRASDTAGAEAGTDATVQEHLGNLPGELAARILGKHRRVSFERPRVASRDRPWEASTSTSHQSRLPLLLVIGTSALLLLLALASCGDDDDDERPERSAAASATLDPSAFSAAVDNPLFPLSSLRVMIYEGNEGDPDTDETVDIRSESRVLERTKRVSGVPVTVVDVREFEDGELVEHTSDYYSQGADGGVRYMGEAVDDIEEGKVVGHEGQWLAGKNGAKPGLFMPADPKVGDSFEQERAPGIAEDRSEVVAVGLEVTTPAGRFDRCIKTEDFAPLDKLTEFKYYCAGVGLVREQFPEGRLDLVRYR